MLTLSKQPSQCMIFVYDEAYINNHPSIGALPVHARVVAEYRKIGMTTYNLSVSTVEKLELHEKAK